MSGTFSVNVAEARGFVAIPADLDKLAVVMGCSSLGSGLSSFYLSGSSAVAARGYGDAVDTLCQVIEQRQANGNSRKFPAAIYTTTATTTGSYGTLDDDGVTGTSVVTVDSSSKPFGTYEAQIKVIAGGTVGTAGITLQWSLDGGRTWSATTALGTATSFTIPNSNVKFAFAAGDLDVDDIATVRTFGGAPDASGIDAAFTALANSTADFSLIICDWDMTAALAAHVTTGLNTLLARGKRVTAIVRSRIPTFETDETDEEWNAAIAADFANFHDSRIVIRAAYELVTDAMTTRQYKRSDLAQFAADVVRVDRGAWPCAPADQPMSNVSLVDADGVTVGHDEGPRGASTGLSDDTLGNRFSCVQRIPDPQRREDVFNAVPWVCYASDERIRNLPTRRLVNAIERTAVSAGISQLGGKLFYTPTGPGTGTLTAASRKLVQSVIFGALSSVFASEIDNAKDASLDTGLVQISPSVTVSGGNLLGIAATIAPLIGGYLLSLGITLAVQE